MTCTINGYTLSSAHIGEPTKGRWQALCEADTEVDITGAVSIVCGATTWQGTVWRGGVQSGKWIGWVVAGANGLGTWLPAKNYYECTLSLPVSDIMTATGETLADASVLSERRLQWHRTAGTAMAALSAVTDALGVSWRALRDGSLLVATPATVERSTAGYELLQYERDLSRIIVAPDLDSEHELPGPLDIIDGGTVMAAKTRIDTGGAKQVLTLL